MVLPSIDISWISTTPAAAELADTPEEIVRIWLTRSATLRHDYDDKICGGLLRATMEAELSTDHSLSGRTFRRLERSFARVFFAKAFLNGDWAAAERVGVRITVMDKFLYAATIAVILFRMAAYRLAGKLPVIGDLFQGPPFGTGILTAALILAIMVLPFIAATMFARRNLRRWRKIALVN